MDVDLFTAIAEMRRITQEGESFSIQFEGYQRDKRKHTGTHRIERCVLRKAATVHQDRYTEYKLYLYDLEARNNRVAWQPLITHFNDQKVFLK